MGLKNFCFLLSCENRKTGLLYALLSKLLSGLAGEAITNKFGIQAV
ncbi:MAG: hypothetical protein WC476_00115 [Phycisphaerae bacterium]|jgi:hypothetical protein